MSEFIAEPIHADEAAPTPARRDAKYRSDAEWFELFEAWQKSGVSINAFAKRLGMYPSVFYRAYQRLGEKWKRESGAQAPAPSASRGDFIEVRAESATYEDSEADEHRPANFSGVEIVAQGGTRVTLSCGFDGRTLRRALETIAGLDDPAVATSSSPPKSQPNGSAHRAKAATTRQRKDGGS